MLDKGPFDNWSFLVQLLTIYFIIKCLWSEKVNQRLAQGFFSLDIEGDIVKMLLLVFLEYLGILSFRKISQLFRITATKYRVNYRPTITWLDVIKKRHEKLLNILLNGWYNLLPIELYLLNHRTNIDSIFRAHKKLHESMIEFE